MPGRGVEFVMRGQVGMMGGLAERHKRAAENEK